MGSNEIQIARKQIVGLLESQKAQITMALPKHLTADRLCRVAVTEMSKNPKLFECTQTSILASIIMAAQLGFEVGVNGHAYLVPYKGVCQLVPGWQGYVDLISRAGRASVWTGAVREGDWFEYTLGSSPKLDHKPGDEDGGDFTFAYAVGWVKGAQWPVIEVWSRAKVKKHLSFYNKVGGMHYALQNENNLEMYGRKVALLQVMKYMPKSIEIQSAQNLEYRAGDGLQNLTISSSGIQDAEFVDVSDEAQQQSATGGKGGAERLRDAVKSAPRTAAPAAQPETQPAATVKPNGHDTGDSEFFN
jgi:recombination protein RecT